MRNRIKEGRKRDARVHAGSLGAEFSWIGEFISFRRRRSTARSTRSSLSPCSSGSRTRSPKCTSRIWARFTPSHGSTGRSRPWCAAGRPAMRRQCPVPGWGFVCGEPTQAGSRRSPHERRDIRSGWAPA